MSDAQQCKSAAELEQSLLDARAEAHLATAQVAELKAEISDASLNAALTEAAALRAQCQRDHELAQEWKALAEGYRIQVEVLRARS